MIEGYITKKEGHIVQFDDTVDQEAARDCFNQIFCGVVQNFRLGGSKMLRTKKMQSLTGKRYNFQEHMGLHRDKETESSPRCRELENV